MTKNNIWQKLPLLEKSALFYLRQEMPIQEVAMRLEDSRPPEVPKGDFLEAIKQLKTKVEN